jgi:hypothetical protein
VKLKFVIGEGTGGLPGSFHGASWPRSVAYGPTKRVGLHIYSSYTESLTQNQISLKGQGGVIPYSLDIGYLYL